MVELRALRRLMIRHPPAYLQRAFALFISLGHYHALLRRLTQVYAERAQVLQEAVRTHLPQFGGRPIHGGSSWWVEGPPDVDTDRLAQAALQAGVVIEPGRVFYQDPRSQDHRHIRLGFSSIDRDKIAEGIATLARVVEQSLR
jgi:GntR family transcriptional regulator/MocR family aminotransferase